MRRLVRRQDGFTLIEVLTASVLMIVVMGVAFTALQQFEDTTNSNTRQGDAQDQARNAMDLLTKRLRSHASPTPDDPQGLDKATNRDLVFKTVDSDALSASSANTHNVMRVRYCLDTSSPANGKLWYQWQRWTTAIAPPAPSTNTCPDGAWGSANKRVLADHLVNDYAGQSRPMWTIDCPTGYDTSQCAAGSDPAMLAYVRRIEMSLFIDADVARRPGETRLDTSVFLRNQNGAPTANFTTSTQGGHLLANASSSTDPDADRLFYRWCYYGQNAPTGSWCSNGTELASRTVALDYSVPPADVNHYVYLGVRVQDPGGLISYYTTPLPGVQVVQ
jgi:type II secretory pathway pseudopilin PulG